MNIVETSIPGLLILEPKVFGDSRGFFMESFNLRELRRWGPPFDKVEFIQDNESKSVYGVVRGLHFQKGEHAQAKLVRVPYGTVLDVALDIRPSSPTFGRWESVILSSENHKELFIPRGFAHGFSVLSESVLFQYKCDNYYCPSSEGAIAWDDPDLGIDWGVPSDRVILSLKDQSHPRLRDVLEELGR